MFSGHKILITGATGQLAGAVAEGLAKTNRLVAIARFSEPGSREKLDALGIETIHCDYATGDFTGVPDDMDYVVHAAANTHPKTADEGMRDNAEGTGLLMQHCAKAKGFLHVSTCGVYLQNPDPEHLYLETDLIGGATNIAPGGSGEGERRQSAVAFPMYSVSKVATEGVVRAMSRALGLPATIARMNVAYGGPYFDGGLPGRTLEALLDGATIRLSKGAKVMQCPIHEDDITDHVGPLLKAASVPATIVNWGGDEGVVIEDLFRYMAGLIGVEPKIEYVDAPTLPSYVLDPTKRKSLGCECKVHWKDGIRRMISLRHPELTLRD